jgi:hypothetical protein
VDTRALQILSDTYWTSAGWRTEPRPIVSEDFEYAKRAGLMFDRLLLSHENIVDRALAALRGVEARAVADAFVVSLSSRRLDLRSALGSFAVLQHFPTHPTPAAGDNCPVCGEYTRTAEPQDLNILNFERLKWGGVRHDHPLYAAFDLEQFARLKPVAPTRDQALILENLLAAIENAPLGTTSAMLDKRVAKVVKSNKHERTILIGILGLCGILSPEKHPGYLNSFVPWSARQLPARRFVDFAYPSCWWTRADGINQQAVSHWFGHLI